MTEISNVRKDVDIDLGVSGVRLEMIHEFLVALNAIKDCRIVPCDPISRYAIL